MISVPRIALVWKANKCLVGQMLELPDSSFFTFGFHDSGLFLSLSNTIGFSQPQFQLAIVWKNLLTMWLADAVG